MTCAKAPSHGEDDFAIDWKKAAHGAGDFLEEPRMNTDGCGLGERGTGQ
jgi:hypothetical protein